jgi:hypothetical protein
MADMERIKSLPGATEMVSHPLLLLFLDRQCVSFAMGHLFHIAFRGMQQGDRKFEFGASQPQTSEQP